MSANSLGEVFKVTSFGESHGPYVGCIIEGCPAGLILDLNKIQKAVDRRKTSINDFSSARIEEDQVEIISGVFEQKTIGSPICILIRNNNTRSQDYDALQNIYRPNHADFTYEQKYGLRDHRGGGRSSIRITAALVAAGEIAQQLIATIAPVNTFAFVSRIHEVVYSTTIFDVTHFTARDQNPLKWLDENSLPQAMATIAHAKEKGDTLGGEISCIVTNLPVGIGEPIFEKLQAQLAHAMLSINTVKGFEYGDGFAAAKQSGSEHNDAFINKNGKVSTASNHSGGIQGGISNGEDIFFKVAFKPISSIKQNQRSINKKGDNIEFKIEGRHDVCAVPRAVAIVEAYTQIVLADLILRNQNSKIK